MKIYKFKKGVCYDDILKVNLNLEGNYQFKENVPYVFTYYKTPNGKRYGYRKAGILDVIKNWF